jgi:hypothetical protein
MPSEHVNQNDKHYFSDVYLVECPYCHHKYEGTNERTVDAKLNVHIRICLEPFYKRLDSISDMIKAAPNKEGLEYMLEQKGIMTMLRMYESEMGDRFNIEIQTRMEELTMNR